MTNASPLRAMMIGAHPDDCDISTYSITTRLVRAGCTVRFVSMTTGNAGHQTLRGKELAAARAREAQASAALLGVTYEILPFDDGRLTPSLEARETLMRTIRRFQLEADDGNVDDAVRACLRRQYGADFADAVRFAESWQVSEYGEEVGDALRALLTGL